MEEASCKSTETHFRLGNPHAMHSHFRRTTKHTETPTDEHAPNKVLETTEGRTEPRYAACPLWMALINV
jgi:hypothetical protein